MALLGATGSIGESTLAVLRENPDCLQLAAIASGSRIEELAAIAREFGVLHVGIGDLAAYKRAQAAGIFPAETHLYGGPEGLVEWAAMAPAEILVSAASGTVGMQATMAAIAAKKDIALASKELLVIAGRFFTDAVRANGVQLLPVDSEHGAIFQCLEGAQRNAIKRLILTASGGPFRYFTHEQMATVTPVQALQHPTWSMGPKITIDSATMANKGLELIEAHWLFGVTPQQLDVVIHPQSIVHSLVEFVDHSTLAQLSRPSMTLPIQYALLYPDRRAGSVCQPLDFTEAMQLEFHPPCEERFPCLRLAREAMVAGGMATAIYNAANEVAVEAFLGERLRFTAVPEVIEHCLSHLENSEPETLKEALVKENEARQLASEALSQFV